MDGSPPGSSVHGILPARILELLALPFSRGSSHHRDQTQDSCIAGRFFTNCITREACSIQFSSVAQSCSILCDPMNRSTPVLPVHHQLLEFTQTHVHQFGDAIQPSHPLSSPSPPAPNPSQLFSNESTLCMRWPMYWSFIFSISPSKEHTSRVLLKILQARLQQYINRELPDVQAGF